MPTLYLFNNLHAGDQLFSRPLYRQLIAARRFELVIAAHRNNAYLFADLCGEGVTRHTSDYVEQGATVLYDLRADCPAGCLPISTWLGEYPDTTCHQWHNVVEVLHRQLRAHGVHFELPQAAQVPMIDFAPRPLEPAVTGHGVYLDNSVPRSGHSTFEFDLRLLAATFPDIQFFCTRRPGCSAPNLVDVSHCDLRDLSAISNQCLAILGKGSGPFCCTYTERNRHKARAVCGYHSESSPTFWDYEGNPLQYLHDMDAVITFLANALAGCGLPTAAHQCT